MKQLIIILLLLSNLVLIGQNYKPLEELDFFEMQRPVPLEARFADDNYFIWCGSLIKGDDGVFHLYYSRWEKKHGFQSWVTHSEVAHATAPTPYGPFTHNEVILPMRGESYWDGMSTHNPTVHKYGSKYYLYYTGNTGDGKHCSEGLNFTHRNNQRIGVAEAKSPNGPWKRFDHPIIDTSSDEGSYDALMVANPSITMRPDSTFLLVYKAVGRRNKLPFGGPVVHLTATSDSPLGPFFKQMEPVFTFDNEPFPAEDPYIWYQDSLYYAIVKDMNGCFTNAGRSLALFKSNDGFKWSKSANSLVSDLTVRWEDGVMQKMDYLERPQLYFENGLPEVLLVAANCINENGVIDESYNIQIPLSCSMDKPFARESFIPGVIWYDDNGKPINAHGGGVVFIDGKYYWYGEHKLPERSEKDLADGGVHCYSSDDLYNWKDEGLVLSVDYEDSQSDIAAGCILERPKVVFNKKSGEFVMYFKLYLKGTGYETGYIGVATSTAPSGPFNYQHKFLGAGSDKGSGDFCMYKNQDEKLYHFTVRKPDKAFCVGELREDYLFPIDDYDVLKEIPLHTEAPAIAYIENVYYMLGSGSTGWAPNAARSFSGCSILGPFHDLGNPCVGVNPYNRLDAEKTYGGQISFILPVSGKLDCFIAMFDLWNPDKPIEGRYVWLPIFIKDGRVIIEWYDEWDLSIFD